MIAVPKAAIFSFTRDLPMQLSSTKRYKAATRMMDKTHIMIPDSQSTPTTNPQQNRLKKSNTSLRGGRHFCHKEDSKVDFLEEYHCGQDKLYMCHHNGVEFTTMCVRFRSPLFRNLDGRDYCGPCVPEDEHGWKTPNSMAQGIEASNRKKEKLRVGQRNRPTKKE